METAKLYWRGSRLEELTVEPLGSEIIEATEPQNLAQVLSVLWEQICKLIKADKQKSVVIAFPSVKALTSGIAVNRLMSHFDSCKDVCDGFGSDVTVTGDAPCSPPALTPVHLTYN